MIIACPACSTRYVVPDTAIGVDGRTVRCARCRHSWFQNGPDLPEREVAALAPATPESVSGPDSPELPEQTAPAAAPPAAAAAPAPERTEPDLPFGRTADAGFAADPAEPPTPPPLPNQSRRNFAPVEQAVDHSPFDHQPPFRPRRNPAKLWTMAAVAFAVTIAALAGAAWYFGVPQWVPGVDQTFGAGPADLVRSFPREKQDRRQLPNGTEYFGLSGTVTNTGKEVRALPEILIVLRDSQDKVVKTWPVPPPQAELAPGESVTINAAVTDVPKSAKVAEIGWKPD